jgi:predicted nucleotidyltransferase
MVSGVKMTTDEIKKKATPVLRSHGVRRAALFGSHARGEQIEGSDLDILVEIEDDLSLLDFIGLKLELEEALGVTVDLVEYSAIKPLIRERVLADQVVIL